MSPLRLPQHLNDPGHVDSGEAHLRFDLLEDIDGAIGRAEHDLEAALQVLREYDLNERPEEGRAPLLEACVQAAYRLVVQREACDCLDHRELIARFRIPPEVLARLGAAH